MKNLQEINQIFWDVVKKYDTDNSNILRKIIHSFDVAKNCFAIASHKKMNLNDRNFAYLVGLFHDIGRFEQWKIFETYDDRKSRDHGDISCEMLQKMNNEKLFGISEKESVVFVESIKYHTKPYGGKDKKIKIFNDILKNADAFSNVVTTANGLQQMTVSADGVTQEIMDGFLDQKPLNQYSPNTKLDRCLMLTACAYYVKELFLREEVIKYNYIDLMFETFSKFLNKRDKMIYEKAVQKLKHDYLK